MKNIYYVKVIGTDKISSRLYADFFEVKNGQILFYKSSSESTMVKLICAYPVDRTIISSIEPYDD